MHTFQGENMFLSPQYIRYLRKKAKMTQKELAERAGVSQSLIARIENGTVDPRYSTLRKIYNVLKKSLSLAFSARDVMNKPVYTVYENDTLRKAAEIMWKKGFSQLPVIDKKGKIKGTISEEIIVRTLLKYHGKIFKIRVKDVMDKPLPTIRPECNIDDIYRILLMEAPATLVVENKKIKGIITKSDIIAYCLLGVSNKGI